MRTVFLLAALVACVPSVVRAQVVVEICLDERAAAAHDEVALELRARDLDAHGECPAERDAESLGRWRIGIDAPEPLGAVWVWAVAPDGAERRARLEGPLDVLEPRALALAAVSLLDDECWAQPIERASAPAEPSAVPEPPPTAVDEVHAPVAPVRSTRSLGRTKWIEAGLIGALDGAPDAHVGLELGAGAALSPWLALRGRAVALGSPVSRLTFGLALGLELVLPLGSGGDALGIGASALYRGTFVLAPEDRFESSLGPLLDVTYTHAFDASWSLFVRLEGGPTFAIGRDAAPPDPFVGATVGVRVSP